MALRPRARASLHTLVMLAALACCGLSPALAQEEEPCDHERYVVLRAGSELDAALVEEVRKDLAAELGARGFGVCRQADGDGERAAEIGLELREPSRISIQVDDYTTGKRVSRDVSLARFPSGGRALGIAIAIDELLRASWAELILRSDAETDYEPADDDASDEPLLRERRRLPISARRRLTFGVRSAPLPFTVAAQLAYTYASGGFHSAGAELRIVARPLGWGWLVLGLGGEWLLPRQTTSGEADGYGVTAALTVGACSSDRKVVFWCGGARTALHWLTFRGREPRAADALQDDAVALLALAVAQLQKPLGARWLLQAELGVGGAPLGARAKDGLRTAMALEGMVLSLGLGAGLKL